MVRHIGSMTMVFLIGLLLGILLEARVFSPIRVAEAVTAVQDDAAVAALESAQPPTATPAADPLPLADAAKANPRLLVEQPVYDFGEVEQGEKISHTFVLRNAGTAPLEISRVQPSCGCTVAKLTSQTIQPGHTAEIDTTLDLNNLSGRQNRLIMVQSNDPKTPVFRLSMVGTSNSRVVREPAVLMLGRVGSEAEATGVVDVKTDGELSLKVTGTRTSDESISARVEEVASGQHFRLTVSLSKAQAGPYQGWIRLMTDHEGTYREIPIPVRAQVGEGGGVFLGDKLDIHGPALDGNEVDIKSFQGSPVVVVFWASWCGHCQHEVPTLVQFHKKYRPHGLQIVGVNVDRERDKAIAAREKWQVPWSDIHFPKTDGKSADPISERYQIGGIPAIFVLDQEGRVVATDARGAKLDEALQTLVQSAKVATRN